MIGEKVLDELGRIPNAERRQALLEYASRLQALEFMLVEEEYEVPDSERLVFPTVLDKALAGLKTGDKLLVREAIDLQCDVFLTTDRQILNGSRLLYSYFGLHVCTLTQFISDEPNLNTLSDSTESMWPDILNYTGLIP